jgi:retinol dehydrogenase 12
MSASIAGKTFLVTGATHGVGEFTARELAASGAEVLVHGRDPALGQRVVESIRAQTGNSKVSLVVADFASLADVRRLAEEVKSRAPRLDCLLNNAGLVNDRRRTSVDGYELTFAVNHLAPFLLTALLRDRLEESAPARIVNVGSDGHFHVRGLDFDDLQAKRKYRTIQVYARSKLCNIMFTRTLARRLEGSGVTANALTPGVVRSNLGKGTFLGLLAKVLAWRYSPVSEGAKTYLYVATSPELEGKSGGYYSKCAPAPISDAAKNDADCERLWRVSEELVGLTGQ